MILHLPFMCMGKHYIFLVKDHIALLKTYISYNLVPNHQVWNRGFGLNSFSGQLQNAQEKISSHSIHLNFHVNCNSTCITLVIQNSTDEMSLQISTCITSES